MNALPCFGAVRRKAQRDLRKGSMLSWREHGTTDRLVLPPCGGRPFSSRPGRAEAGVIGSLAGKARLQGPLMLDSGRVAVSFAPVFREKLRLSGASVTASFVCPGQGSQAVGMGKALAEAFAPARDVFEEVDA